MIETQFYSISGGTYLRLYLNRYRSRYFTPIVIATLAMAVCAVYDFRWALVLLMTIFIIIPMGLSLVYISEALRPEARYSIRRKCLKLSTQGIEFTFQDNEDAPASTIHLPWSSFTKAETIKNGVIVTFRNNNAILFIPYSAVSDVEHLMGYITVQLNHQ